MLQLNSEMEKRISSGWFVPPLEIYSRPLVFSVGRTIPREAVQNQLSERRYRERSEGETLRGGDYAWLEQNLCASTLQVIPRDESKEEDSLSHCLMLHRTESQFGPSRPAQLGIIAFDSQNAVKGVWVADPKVGGEWQTGAFYLEPILFAQFYGDEPLLRTIVRIGEVPLQCSQAVTAIEDAQFLKHSGVSFTGLTRALLTNLFEGRYAQGGSTITQQLVKNYFLTPEKSLKRKVTEIFMALLLEFHADKDQILENYLNVIYMGQNGAFQIRGFAAASEHYFARPLSELGLADCALLAAIVNSPGRFNPFTASERALERRNLVLSKMLANEMIDQEQMNQAAQSPLPKPVKRTLNDPAPYFIQAAFRYLDKKGVSREEHEGLRIFTTLDPFAQNLAQRQVIKEIDRLESENKKVKAIKEEKKKNLEMTLISVDLESGGITALVGGRQYLKTQYNRVLDANRQVGSVMKPFVYLAALESRTPEGEPYTATTIIEDIPFRHRYEGQTWSPRNYTREHFGPVPMFYALKNSLNISTAKLALSVGLSNVIDVAERAGITSEMKPFPSLSLGAFEIKQWELAQAFSTIARFGEYREIHTVDRVEDLTGEEIYQFQPTTEQRLNPTATAELIGMMKQNLITGTGRLAFLRGFTRPAAGKTGTTSDTKDSWYVGFTPRTLTVTWSGYDDNTPSGLTGASGALPLWTDYMRAMSNFEKEEDFKWPAGVRAKSFSRGEIEDLLPPQANDYEKVETELIFSGR